MKSNNYAISIYPLSLDFKRQLETKLGTPVNYLLLRQIRQLRFTKIWKYLRTLKVDNLLFPIEYDNFKLLIPLLKLISWPITAQSIKIVYKDFTFVTLNKHNFPGQIFPLLKHLFIGYRYYLKNYLNTSKLLQKSTCHYQLNDSRRVLYLDPTVWLGPMTGGCVGHISGVVNALVNRDYSVDYAALDRLPTLSAQTNFIKLVPPKMFVLPEAINRFTLNEAMISQLLKKNCSYQFIYQRMSINNYAGVMLSQKFKIPLIVEYNGPLVWVSKVWGNHGRLRFEKYAEKCEYLCLKHAHLIVTISKVLEDHLISKGIPKDKIICYPNGIDPTIFDPDRFSVNDKTTLRRKHNIPENAIVFCFIGTFGQWHGVTVLTQAIKKLIDEHCHYANKNILRFLLIGNGVEYPVVQNILNKSPYEDYIIFTDVIPQEKAPEYLAIADAFLSPHVPNIDGSRFFGSPTKLFEYMSMAKPIIASKLEQVGDILKNSLEVMQLPSAPPSDNASELGILCEPGNIDHIIKAIIFLVDHGQWRKVLGENAKREVMSKFTWDKNVDHFTSKLVGITQ